MQGFSKILLATDFSSFSDNALDHATTLAQLHNAELHVLHVNVTLQDLYGGRELPDHARFQQALDRVAQDRMEEIPRNFDVEIHREIVHDVAAAPAICSYILDNSIDLTVVGTHGRTGLSRMVMGSVAREVVRNAHSSVLVVHGAEPDPMKRARPPYKKILVPLDLSHASPQALNIARYIKDTQNGEILAAHVIEELFYPPYYDATHQPTHALPMRVKYATNALREFVQTQEDPNTIACLATDGRAHRRIVEIAEEQGSDLIVMGSSGRGRLERFLVGSVAERVLGKATCPVLIVQTGATS